MTAAESVALAVASNPAHGLASPGSLLQTHEGQGTDEQVSPAKSARQGAGICRPVPWWKTKIGLQLLVPSAATVLAATIVATATYLARPDSSKLTPCLANDSQPCTSAFGAGYHVCTQNGAAWSACKPIQQTAASGSQIVYLTDRSVPVKREGSPSEVDAATKTEITRQYLGYLNAYVTNMSKTSRQVASIEPYLLNTYRTIRVTLDPASGGLRRDVLNLTDFIGRIRRLGQRYDSVSVGQGESLFRSGVVGRIVQTFRQHFRGMIGNVVLYEDCGTKVIAWHRQDSTWLVDHDFQVNVAACGTGDPP